MVKSEKKMLKYTTLYCQDDQIWSLFAVDQFYRRPLLQKFHYHIQKSKAWAFISQAARLYKVIDQISSYPVLRDLFDK